jgi:hypothetical protein
MIPRQLEARRHHRLRRALSYQPAVRPLAQRQPERIEQDRLPRPRLPGKRAKSPPELEIERLDQHHIADGQPRQHRRLCSLLRRA